MARRFGRDVEAAIAAASQRNGIPINIMRAIATVESGGNPRNSTGSYRGLFQLSRGEFERAGGRGDILDPFQNASAAGRLLAGHQEAFRQQYGREPTATELYMAHQQGWGGLQEHLRNPDRPAWQNMAATREGRERDARGPVYRLPNGEMGLWSQAAVAGNALGRDWRTTTGAQLMEAWNERLGRAGAPGPSAAQIAGYGDQGASSLDPQPQPPGTPRDLSALSPRELTNMAPSKTSPFEDFTGLTPNMENIAASTTPPIVQGVEPSWTPGTPILGNLFGEGTGKIGAALSAAGRAIMGSGPKVPAMTDTAKLMAEVGPEGQWPTIQARPQRRIPGRG